MIWNQHLLYQIIDVWYHIRKLYLINNEKNDKIKLNHFFYKRRPIGLPSRDYYLARPTKTAMLRRLEIHSFTHSNARVLITLSWTGFRQIIPCFILTDVYTM